MEDVAKLEPTPVLGFEARIDEMGARVYKFTIRRGAKPWFNLGDYLRIVTDTLVEITDEHAVCCAVTMMPLSLEDEYIFRTF